MTVEDLYDQIEVIVFPKTYEKVQALMVKDQEILIQGRLQLKEDEPPKIIAEKISPIEGSEKPQKFFVRFETETRESMETVHKLLKIHEKTYLRKGRKSDVIFYIQDSQKKLKTNCHIVVTEEIIKKIEGIVGLGNVKLG